jgi:hypothetical protein
VDEVEQLVAVKSQPKVKQAFTSADDKKELQGIIAGIQRHTETLQVRPTVSRALNWILISLLQLDIAMRIDRDVSVIKKQVTVRLLLGIYTHVPQLCQ